MNYGILVKAQVSAIFYVKGSVSSMKKLAMLTVKGAVGLIPKAVRNKLKTNHHLTEFYSRSLQRSGLFYGFPSEKKRRALYRAYLKHQGAQLATLSLSSANLKALYVVIVGHAHCAETIQSALKAGIAEANIYVVTTQNVTEMVKCATHVGEVIASLPNDARALFLNSGDELMPDGLEVFDFKSNSADIVYCDTDRISAKNQRISPYFLPDWNPDLQLSTGYVSTGVLIRTNIAKQASITACSIAGMIAELWLKNASISVQHIPFTLVHRVNSKLLQEDALRDIREAVSTYGEATSAYNQQLGVNLVQWPVFSKPKVSLIIPTKNGKDLVKACVESILEKTTYQNFEILLIDNNSDEQDSLDYFDELNRHQKIRVLRYPEPFNYSAINNFGVKHTCPDSEVIGLINNDIEVIKPEWLTHMVGHALREDVGCVGAKLLYSDDRVQHAGVVLGYGGGAGHAHKYFPRYHPGYMKRLIATQNYSAVTAACLLVKKSLFNAVGGLNEKDLAVAFNDVDFCLRVKEAGVRNVYCAEAELYHHESVSRGTDHAPEKAARFNRELAYLKNTWAGYIQHDPAYSPNLTLKRENFSVKTKEEFELT